MHLGLFNLMVQRDPARTPQQIFGDAWASRNVQAAMFDTMRVCKDL